MIYTDATKRAMNLCFTAHKNQRDLGGSPYVFHPFHLAEEMPDEDCTVAALLHDVVEDTAYTLEDLGMMGFNPKVIHAVDLLTRKKGTTYMEYIAQIKTDRIARTVKLADLRHNADQNRLCYQSESSRKLMLRYQKAMKMLTEEPSKADKQRAYERYCLQWMLDHDITLNDLIHSMEHYRSHEPSEQLTIPQLFEEWQKDQGFSGKIWACFEEWNDSEYIEP